MADEKQDALGMCQVPRSMQNAWHGQASPRSLVLLTSSLQIPSNNFHRSTSGRWTGALPLLHHIQVCRPSVHVTLSAGVQEKASGQLVCCPGPSVSGFSALHNLSISTKYICHSPLSGDREMSRLFQTSEEEECYITQQRPGTEEKH